MNGRLWKVYLLAMAVAIASSYGAPGDGWARVSLQVAVGWAGAAAVVVGVRRHRPPGQAAWYLFALGVFANSGGILVEAVSTQLGVDNPPTPADVFYLALYPALVAGMAVLLRRRASVRDWVTVLDALTISTGLGLLTWVFIIRPSVGDPDLSPFGQLVGALYPIGDVVVLMMIVRLLLSAGSRTPAYWTLAGSVLAFLGGDVAWAVYNQVGVEPGPVAHRLLQMMFLAGYGLFGLAALHPSMRDLAEPAPARASRLSMGMLVVLATVSLTAPGILLYEVLSHQVSDGVAISIGSAVLFLLVVLRMAQLLRQVERQSRRLQELTQVDELTGLPNRRAWSYELPRAIERARRDGQPLAVAMVDLDHFKLFNDEYGHPAGDRLLRSAGVAWQGQLRAIDRLARYGGEEFIVLLPDADPDAAAAVLERLLRATPLGQTFSAGIAGWDGTETSDDLIARADRALYRAKQEGRNRLVLADAAPVPDASAA